MRSTERYIMLALSGNAIGLRPIGVVWLKTFQRDIMTSVSRDLPPILVSPGTLEDPDPVVDPAAA